MKFYKRDPDAAIAGMNQLSFAQRGAYNSLLDLLYSRDGDVPDDDALVARMMGAHWREWGRLKRDLITAGKVWIEDGRLCANRVNETLKEAEESSKTQRERAEKRRAAKRLRHSCGVSDPPRDAAEMPHRSKKANENNDATMPLIAIAREERKKEADPLRGSDASASPDTVRDPRGDLFDRGRQALMRITGKTSDSCRSLIGRWLKAVDDEAIHVLAAIDDAEQQRVADPVAWINRRLQPRAPPAMNGRPLTFREQEKQQTREILDALDRSIERDRETSGQAHLRLLPRD